MKKKLLFIGTYPPPYGGISTHLYELLPELVKNGYEVITLTDSGTDERTLVSKGMKNIFIKPRKYFYKNVIKVLFFALLNLHEKRDLSWKLFMKVINFSHLVNKLAKKENVSSFFYYHIEEGLILPIIKKSVKQSSQHIWMIFGEVYVNPEKYRKMSKYLQNAFSKTDVISASSQYCADSLSDELGFNFPTNPIYVGVDDEKYMPIKNDNTLRDELKIPIDAPVFLFFGRMIKDMGVDFILNNSNQLLETHPKVHLIIAGAYGDLSANVEDLSKQQPRVHYCSEVPFEKKIKFYSTCDVFLAPSFAKRACMGISIKEAMACGKPIIASNSGGIKEAVEDNVNGYLIPFKEGVIDTNAFITRAKELIYDSSLMQKMGENGRLKVLKQFTNEQTTKKYLDIINKNPL